VSESEGSACCAHETSLAAEACAAGTSARPRGCPPWSSGGSRRLPWWEWLRRRSHVTSRAPTADSVAPPPPVVSSVYLRLCGVQPVSVRRRVISSTFLPTILFNIVATNNNNPFRSSVLSPLLRRRFRFCPHVPKVLLHWLCIPCKSGGWSALTLKPNNQNYSTIPPRVR